MITTLDTNIGDDFIRTGLCLVLKHLFREREIEFVYVNKHRPYTAYSAWHPVRIAGLAKYFPRGKRQAQDAIQSLLATPSLSKFESCDAVVQCGAPVLWPQCHRCEWAVPIWHEIIGRIFQRIPVLNLAAGSSYPWECQPPRIEDPGDARFLTTIHDYCRVTTVRDRLSQLLFKGLGFEVPLIPCSALLASGEVQGKQPGNGNILINYMPGGGHFDFGQGIDARKWRDTVLALISALSKRHKLAFLCHSEAERKAASDLGIDVPSFFPRSIPEYFAVAAEAKAGIFNRMHASVALAGMGIPSIAVGSDTRLLMVERLGLPTFFVKEASAERLEAEVENLIEGREQNRDRLLSLRAQTWQSYRRVISDALL